jgi:hypothetical protein
MMVFIDLPLAEIAKWLGDLMFKCNEQSFYECFLNEWRIERQSVDKLADLL